MSRLSDECSSCKFKEGDCGNHHVDFEGKVHFDIPSECACDKYGGCMFWKRSIESREKEIEKIKRIIEKQKDMIAQLEQEIEYEKTIDKRIESSGKTFEFVADIVNVDLVNCEIKKESSQE